VKIAVLDSGIDMNHPRIQDLIQKTSEWNQDRLVSKSFVGLDDNLDPVGHGTHIGGTIMSIAQGAKLYMGGVVERNKRVNTEALAEVGVVGPQIWLRSDPFRPYNMRLRNGRLTSYHYLLDFQRGPRKL
jgi:subtilisin family serine protease